MIYPEGHGVLLRLYLGVLAGGLVAGLWMRARLARLESAKQFAETGATKLEETFQALADAALRSNQSAFLDAARTTLETTRAEMSGDLAQKQTAIEGVVQPLADSWAAWKLKSASWSVRVRRLTAAWASRCNRWRARPRRFPPRCVLRRPAAAGAK